jgi:sigma-B regulation protein RsbU (phosphoserine phosphatase)
MCRTSGVPEPAGTGDEASTDAAFTALLEDSAEDLYESAPCGYLSTMMDGTLTRYTLRAAAHHDPEPGAALATLNAVLHERYTASGDPRYCTCVFGVIEPGGELGSATVRIASGGHPSALVLRADGRAEFLPTPGGLLVGVLPGAPIGTAETVLGPGDAIVLYTDGLTEARLGPGRDDLYGEEALHAFATEHAPATPQEVITALTGLLKSFGDGLDDDTALLALGAPSRTRPATSRAS